MKKLLFALILLSNITDGQTTTWHPHLSIDTIIEPPHQTDTVRVLMLLCDTTNYKDDLWTTRVRNLALWAYGYSLRENTGGLIYNSEDDERPKYFWKHLYYLDDKKKRLGKNIVVWQSKEL